MKVTKHEIVVLAGVAALATVGLGGPADAATAVCASTNPPNTMTLVGGTPQTARLQQPFDSMLAVTLGNTNGCPVTTAEAGLPVTFTAPSSGASGTFSASGSNTVTVGTDASGQASAVGFTANGNAGSYTVTASSDYGSVTFSLTNTASGIATTITPAAPTTQSATAGSRYPQPLQATVLDAIGNPVDGASVVFTLGSSGGTGAGASTAGASFDGGAAQATELTDSSGTATSPLFTANSTPGMFTATAATQGVVEPADYSLDNLAGKRPTISALAPGNQRAATGAHYGKPLAVKLLDGSSKPLQGASVTFTLGSAASGDSAGAGGSVVGGSFADGSSQATETTDASGVATSPRFSANTTAGRFTATATTPGTSEVVSFSLDNLAGKPPTITPLAPARQSTTTSARYPKPLRVKVRDGRGDPLQGATVTFTLGSAGSAGSGTSGSAGAGGSFADGSSQATETTNASGIATSPRFTANTTAGRFASTAVTTGTADVAGFSLDNRAGRSPTITTTGKEKRSAIVGAHYAKPLQVELRDPSGKPLQGANVTFTLNAISGSAGSGSAAASFVGGMSQATEVTSASGIATSPRLIANATAGTIAATATTAATPDAVSFTLHNLPGRPATITAGVAATESTAAGTRFPIRLAVTVADSHDNPVAGIDVEFSAPASGATGRFAGKKRTVMVKTDAKGIAVAPSFVAGRTQGGYIVRVTAAGHSAAFALVNQTAS